MEQMLKDQFDLMLLNFLCIHDRAIIATQILSGFLS